MRKWIWGGIALTVCSAVGVYLAGCYAANHPNSFFSCCTTAANRVVQSINPVAAVGATVQGAFIPVPTVPALQSEVQPEAVEPIVIETQDEEYHVQVGGFPESFLSGLTPEGFFTPDPPENPEKMPYADELVTTDEPPVTEDGCEHCWMKSMVMEFLRGLAQVMGQGSPEVQVQDEGTSESQEPSSEEANEDTENPTDQPKEDPYYHHQYPSCPYTGACPYPHSYYVPPVRPVETPEPAPQPEPSQPKKKKFSLFNWSFEIMEQQGVDTMECRPTDLPPGPQRGRPY
jgi:hypothetical protein